MIYIDTSVVMAELLVEERHPPHDFWNQSLVSSRLLEYEMWTVLNRKNLRGSYAESAESLLSRVAIAEMTRPILARATEPFPADVRTLDALHLATISFISSRLIEIELATYDIRLQRAAEAMGLTVLEL